MEERVRLISLSLSNIKNVRQGKITMPDSFLKDPETERAGVLGIYGQNGSGKTAVINSLYFLRLLLTGEPLSAAFSDIADVRSEKAGYEAVFRIFSSGTVIEMTYRAAFVRREKGYIIDSEELLVNNPAEGAKGRKRTVLSFVREEDEPVLLPKKRFSELCRENKKHRVELPVALKLCERDNRSLIFGSPVRALYEAVPQEDVPYLSLIIRTIHEFSLRDFFVILSGRSAYPGDEVRLKTEEAEENLSLKDFSLDLTGPKVYRDSERKRILYWARGINTVLNCIIPGMQIEVRDLGRQIMDDGEEGYRIELLSRRENIPAIPLLRESEGIVKIISVLNSLIRAFEDPSVLVCIDELDAGVYEYMLGELMDIFENSARGQLIFTSHNLRALEMLNDESVMFSTANPENRFIRMKHRKSTVNLRDVYLRGITLGGQEEVIYEETDSLKIARAFRKAARLNEHE